MKLEMMLFFEFKGEGFVILYDVYIEFVCYELELEVERRWCIYLLKDVLFWSFVSMVLGVCWFDLMRVKL